MFPPAWRSREVGAMALSLDRSEASRSREIMRRAMDKYPSALLRNNLRQVYVVKKLMFYGLSYGGTNSLDTLYLANRGEGSGFTDRYLEESFHHEFSSILLRNYGHRLDRKAWMACNPPGFRYWGNGTEAVRTGAASTQYQSTWHRQGFLAQYATASIEEDLNMIAEGLFCGGSRFWRLCQAYPRLRAKADVAVRFYRSLDRDLDEEAFRAFAETELAQTASDLDYP